MGGTCKLRGQTAQLVKSHVIPKALQLPEGGLRIYSADLPLDEQETEGEQPADLQNPTRFVDRVGVDRLFCRYLDGVRIS